MSSPQIDEQLYVYTHMSVSSGMLDGMSAVESFLFLESGGIRTSIIARIIS